MPGHRKRRQFKQTDAFTRGMVIGLKRAGWSIRQIAADTHLGASTVHRLWRRWLEQGNVAIYRNVGATRVTSARVDRRIFRQAVAAPQATCTAILQHVQDTLDHSISTRTISRRLVANGLHSCRPLRRLPLTPPNRRQRLEWCRARSTWMTEWHRVVFSDESRFCLSSDSRRVRVWRRRGERSNPAAIVERPTVRQRGIMVWGAIAYDSRSPLLRIQGTMTAQRYVDDVLRPVTLPYLQGVPNALYQQDNARPHTARISQQALQDVQMLPWPPYSPDLSPIEHVWDIIGRRLHALPKPRSEDELWQMVEREWRAIPQDAIRTLIDSLPRRVAACIAVRDPVDSIYGVVTEGLSLWCGNREGQTCSNRVGQSGRVEFSKAKERLLRTFKDGESKRIRKLLSGIELGDLKPSQLLPKLRSLATEDLSVKFIKTLWLEKLPQAIQQILIISEEELDKLAVMADRIAELNPKAEIYKDIQVCYTRTTKYAIPGVPSMLYQEYQVCYTRTTKYAIPGVPSMLYQDYQVCYTRSTKYAIPGLPREPRMFHKENQVCYTSSGDPIIPASREDPIGPSSKPQPSKPGVRFDLPKETRSRRRIKTPSRMIETRSGKMQDPAQERIKVEEFSKPQPGATIGRYASADPVVLNPNIDITKYDGTEDLRPWIESLEEIGFLYHCADYVISRHDAMNMIGSAKTWLNLHKISFTS
ncbi:hypothetical protein LAZ67_1007101 [Cordylochernes scorpioides]|uniref:Transposase n=1 Tax=Cordylochernes scorpioides TaxID=51811 RepID=A0ABY6JZ20_9ARAC|nr:hypothetical protein LAZ67_1007101 [Cordylochernes scorpioides]